MMHLPYQNWGCGAAGSVLEWHSRGRGFDPRRASAGPACLERRRGLRGARREHKGCKRIAEVTRSARRVHDRKAGQTLPRSRILRRVQGTRGFRSVVIRDAYGGPVIRRRRVGRAPPLADERIERVRGCGHRGEFHFHLQFLFISVIRAVS